MFGLFEINLDNEYVFNKNPMTIRYQKYSVTISNTNNKVNSGNVIFTED